LITTQYKKCLYCGRSNSADALECEGCGGSSFGPVQVEVVPTYPNQPVYIPPVRIVQIPPAWRILFFIFAGIFIVVYWLLFAAIFFVTVLGQPLAMSMFRTVPTVATLYRDQQPFGTIIADGWRATVTRYLAAPLWGKVLAPAIFVGCIVGLFLWWYG
jgi:uncharacterized membrane protein YccF (DUF307 family)